MKPSNYDPLDQHLDQLRLEIQSIHAPRWMEWNDESIVPLPADNDRNPNRVATHRRRNWWLTGLAASILAAFVGFSYWQPSSDIPPVTTASASVTGHLVVRTITPVTVQSITRGAEVHYLESRLISDSNGFTRVIYVVPSY